ncbi:MAG: AAA family ATPase [Treponema sp.]|jgi:exonuclease SbcC|nr:AAA family ATPase [Treponema sp.]
MRPRFLLMENFGPFPGTVELNFRALGDIFLITGKTGAGKTSVFDAICYALYGTVPGSRGASVERLISDFAGRGAEAFVRFEFSSGTNLWRVDRTLRITGGKDGVSKTDTQAMLYRAAKNEGDPGFDESWEAAVLRKNETNAKLISILNLEAQEFFKIILLPQGEFAEFLKLKTQDRRQILAKLFPIEKAQRVIKSVREKTTQIKADAAAAEKLLGERQELVRFEDYDKKHLEAKERALKTREEAVLAEQNYREGRDTFALFEERGKEQEKAEADAKEKTRLRTALSRELETLDTVKAEDAAAAVELGVLQACLPCLESLIAHKEKKEALEKEQAAAASDLADAAGESALYGQKIAALDEDKKRLEEKAAELEDLEKRWEREHTKLRNLRELSKELHEENELKNELLTLEKQKAEKKEHLVSLERMINVQEKELAGLQEAHKKTEQEKAAAVLASVLREGEACPVCGAEHHPLPASLPKREFGITERIAALETGIRDGREKRGKLGADLEHCEHNYTLCVRRIDEKQEVIVPLAAFASAGKMLPEVSAELAACSKSFEELANMRDDASRARNKLISFFEERTELSTRYNRAEKTAAALVEKQSLLARQINSLNQEMDELKNKLNPLREIRAFGAKTVTDTREDLKLQQLRRRIHERETFRKTYAVDREKCVAAFSAALSAEAAALERKTESNARFESARKKGVMDEARLGELEAQKDAGALASQNAAHELAVLEDNKRLLDEAAARVAALSVKAARLDALDRDLSGHNPKKKPFDSWLLGLYLAEVAAFANKRLERMSEGRYSLQLETEGIKRGFSGLGLSVFDQDTGRKRPCGTLSGGETFMASISLALGLADSIQAHHGGLEIEAVFIDEGFGSLDDETLQKALTILDELRQTRMVALISHVGEMRSQIPSRVEVLKTQTGSKITVL